VISSNEFELLPVFRLEPSQGLRALILGPVLGAWVLIGLSGSLPLPFKIAAGILCLMLAGFAWRSHWPKQRSAIRAFGPAGLTENRQWWLETQGGRRWQGELTDAVVWPTLIVFSVKTRYRSRGIIVPYDAMPGEAHRRLRRLLLAR